MGSLGSLVSLVLTGFFDFFLNQLVSLFSLVYLVYLDYSVSLVSFPNLGKDPATKSDEFLEKCQRGGGSFSIQKSILQILGTLNRAF